MPLRNSSSSSRGRPPRSAQSTQASRALEMLGTASARFDPYATGGLKGFETQQDATGLNGQEGYDRAVGTFHESPGYRYAVDQALDGINRHSAATGTLASGNTLAALGDRAGHMADQGWGDWYGRVNGLGQTGFNATSAQAGFDRAGADTITGDAARRAGVYTDSTGQGLRTLSKLGENQMDINTGYARDANQSQQNDRNFYTSLAGLGTSLLGARTSGGSSILGS